MKRNEYIIYISISIYLYIMKYYDLVFEVGIEKYFHGSTQSALFRVLLKAPFAVFGYSWSCVE